MKAFLATLRFLSIVAFRIFLVFVCWNIIVPELDGPEIHFLQATAMYVIVRLLIGGCK